MANPYSVYTAGQDGSINQGLAGVFGALQRKNEKVAQEEKQQQAIDAQNALNAQASDVFQNGTPEEISSFMIANPSAQNQIISADKFLNDRTKQSKLNAARDIAMGMDPQQSLGRSAQEIQAEGGDPKDTIAMANQPPEVQKAASEKLWASMDPQGYKAWKSSQPESMTEYQRATVEGKKADQELRREEALIKREENKLKRETDDLKRQELQQKIDASKAKVDEAKKAKQVTASNAANQAYESISRVDDLLSNDGYMSSITGYQGRTPDFLSTTEGLEATAYLDNLKNSLTIENLSSMSGPKTDKDIAVIASSASALKAGMGKEAMERELKKIKKVYDRVAKQKIKDAGGADKVIAIEAHPKYGDVTEADIEKTMKSWGMTRSQVMRKLNNG